MRISTYYIASSLGAALPISIIINIHQYIIYHAFQNAAECADAAMIATLAPMMRMALPRHYHPTIGLLTMK